MLLASELSNVLIVLTLQAHFNNIQKVRTTFTYSRYHYFTVFKEIRKMVKVKYNFYLLC